MGCRRRALAAQARCGPKGDAAAYRAAALPLAGLTPAQVADIEAHVRGLTVPDDAPGYTPPAHGWTCFHCGETFVTEAAARLHFGPPPDGAPGCVLKLEAGEAGLLALVRDRDAEIERLRAENEQLASAVSSPGAST